MYIFSCAYLTLSHSNSSYFTSSFLFFLHSYPLPHTHPLSLPSILHQQSITVSACGEIAAQSSVYIGWLFRPIEKTAYNLSLSLKYYPTPIDIDSCFGDFERGDEQGNYGDRVGYDVNGNGNANSFESEYRVSNWREEGEGRGGNHGEEGRGEVEEKGESASSSYPTGSHACIDIMYVCY